MVTRNPKYHPRRINRYTPAMGYHAGLVHGAPHEVNFGPMAVADVDLILNNQSIASAGSTTTFLVDNTDPVNSSYTEEFPVGPGFGRCLQIVLSGAGTPAIVIKGRDYLGQPMSETFTGNGTTPVIGTKAFKYIDLISWAALAGETMDVGTTDKLGLPFRMANVLAEELDGVRVATLGTLVTPSLVDPATATTTDPRGTYDPQSTLNGTAYLSAWFLANGALNSSGNGGLHGLAHYYA
jgi:hypothetical protein